MQIALDNEASRVLATPGLDGRCPACGKDVRAKCGEIKIWHWAHISADCDEWSEPESYWHANWKSWFPDNQVEVVIGNHRADLVVASTVIELQHSPIATTEIRKREDFYGQMLWIVDASPFIDNLKLRERTGFYSFRWKWPRLSWASARRPILFDMGDDGEFGGSLFHIRKISDQTPCGGWGTMLDARSFINQAKASRLPYLQSLRNF